MLNKEIPFCVAPLGARHPPATTKGHPVPPNPPNQNHSPPARTPVENVGLAVKLISDGSGGLTGAHRIHRIDGFHGSHKGAIAIPRILPTTLEIMRENLFENQLLLKVKLISGWSGNFAGNCGRINYKK